MNLMTFRKPMWIGKMLGLLYLIPPSLIPVRKSMIVNQVLLSKIWLFITIWGDSNKVIKEIRAMLCNYLWLGHEHHTRTRINWQDSSTKERIGGLGIINHEDAMTALLCKWVTYSFLPGRSNLQTLLKYSLSKIQPTKKKTWPANTA